MKLFLLCNCSLIFLPNLGFEEKLCLTTSGPSAGNPCNFPFKFKGVVHHECTWIEGHGKPWCATLVNEYGPTVQGEENRGVCGHDCPIPPNPENATYTGWYNLSHYQKIKYLIKYAMNCNINAEGQATDGYGYH
jgi:hypothetical protein